MRTINRTYTNRLFALILLVLALHSYSKVTYRVEEHGRRIQPDGFLMEWEPQKAKTLEDGIWIWDAVNTPDGPAGYFSTNGQTVCPEWFFSFSPDPELTRIIQIPDGENADLFGINMEAYEEQGSVTFEWVIPWDQVDPDDSGFYEITINAFSTCGDTLQTVFLKGEAEFGISEVITPRMILQAVLIVILLVVYFWVRRWVRNQTDRRRSPHRSA